MSDYYTPYNYPIEKQDYRVVVKCYPKKGNDVTEDQVKTELGRRDIKYTNITRVKLGARAPIGWEPKPPHNTYIIDLEDAQPAFLFTKDPTEADVVDSVVKRLAHDGLNSQSPEIEELRYEPLCTEYNTVVNDHDIDHEHYIVTAVS